ncbi:DNA-3-methyladenine glycosylase [Solitalea longa]|uniref:Putative 3-methyladenine DNA glycosylase n=1 Tax=Solitalea longa TaxID=2079460 RepID=A0A2S4ZWV7_9SPHI|nr:DNA-3-methyladenine glycosylase [Solitalea longa]POY34854.1 DNA-3-methyladenine glycosylase [Solitalea longa]
MYKLPFEFYLRDDVVQISRDLLGKHLYTKTDGVLTGGMITETEAYRAPDDKASHAYNLRRTARTETMFKTGGTAYVYLCYGIHSLFNVVTNIQNVPHAVLIRSIEPVEGIDIQLQRRGLTKLHPKMTSGPGAMAKALGITRQHNALSLLSDEIWIEDKGLVIPDQQIVSAPRVGVDYAGDDALRPWRFYLADNKFVSKRLKV